MLIPGVDDAPHTLEGLSTVFAFYPLVQPVECCVARVDGLVRWRLSIPLNRCEEVVSAVRLSVGTDVEVQPRSERVDGRRRQTVSRFPAVEELFEGVDCFFVRCCPRVAIVSITETKVAVPEFAEGAAVMASESREERPCIVSPKPLVGRFLTRRIDTLLFEARGDLSPVQFDEVLEQT